MKIFRKKGWFFLLLAMCWFVSSGTAEAASAKKLFSVVVNDGFASQSVAIYLHTANDGSTSVGPKAGVTSLPVYAGAKTASISLKSKSSLFKNTYKSVSYKKTVTLASSRTLTLKLKKKDGTVQKASLKLKRPSMPKISSLSVSPSKSSGFTPGSSKRLTIKLNVRSFAKTKAYFVIKNSNGKIVYRKDLQEKKNVNYTCYWSGKPSKGNEAGLSADQYVAAGTYKLTAYLPYKVGSKTKLITKTATVKVNASEIKADTDGSRVSSAWTWNVILSGDDTLDYLAEKICKETLNSSMSEAQRAKALYTWMGNNMTHAYSAPKTGGKAYMDITSAAAKSAVTAYAKEAATLKKQGKASVNNNDNYFSWAGSVKKRITWITQGLVYRNGDCLIMAMVYATLCRHAGIETDVLENSLGTGGNGHHFWNVIKINGVYYMTDVDMVTYSKGVSSYNYFLRGTNNFYTANIYKKVKTSGTYAIAKKVSKTDCPNR